MLTLCIKCFGALIAFLVTVSIARLSGADGSGLFFLGLSLVSVLSIFCRLGFDKYIVREIGRSESGLAHGLSVQATTVGLVSVLLVSSSVALCLYGFRQIFAETLFSKSGLAPVLGAFAPGLVSFSITVFLGYVLQGGRKAAAAALFTQVVTPSLFLLLLIVSDVEQADGLARLWALAAHSALALAVVFCTLLRVPVLTFSVDKAQWLSVLGGSYIFLSVVVLGQLSVLTGQLVGGVYLEADELGVLAVIQRLASLASFGLLAVNFVVAPLLAQSAKKMDRASLRYHSRRAMAFSIGVSAPFVLVAMLFPKFLLGLFGEEYEEYSSVLWILMLGQVINLLAGPVANLLVMCGLERVMRQILVLNVLVCGGLLVILTQLFGLLGCAAGSAIMVAFQNVAGLIVVENRLNLKLHVRNAEIQ